MFLRKVQVMAVLGVKDGATIRRMIQRGDLPPFDVGDKGRKQGWYEPSFRAFYTGQDVGRPLEIAGQEMNVDPLSGPNARMAKELRDVADRNAFAKQLRGEQVTKRMWPKRRDPGSARNGCATVQDGLPGPGVSVL